jgi:hypothetical protein
MRDGNVLNWIEEKGVKRPPFSNHKKLSKNSLRYQKDMMWNIL